MVTFRPDISYATAREKAAKQSAVLSFAGHFGTAFLSATALYTAWSLNNSLSLRRNDGNRPGVQLEFLPSSPRALNGD
ncbi:hypothetical protein JVT61DRAFT_2436 [Boletus reticuloceps]|uniref:Uncharacterized protein n=1 Tax=Boletus reticuloceps TaxID=495285 RepID=A0A8I3A950_9AGAM|nr:hypothetical protein JVT61DRAFT_2436 [Boletus reticuloceps]